MACFSFSYNFTVKVPISRCHGIYAVLRYMSRELVKPVCKQVTSAYFTLRGIASKKSFTFCSWIIVDMELWIKIQENTVPWVENSLHVVISSRMIKKSGLFLELFQSDLNGIVNWTRIDLECWRATVSEDWTDLWSNICSDYSEK